MSKSRNEAALACGALRWLTVLLISAIFVPAHSQQPMAETGEVTITVNQVTTSADDEYICQTIKLKADHMYITKYTPLIDRGRVHHMLVFACTNAVEGLHRSCGSPCMGPSRYIYAWANKAPEMTLPKDVSFAVGAKTPDQYITVQLHYKDKFSDPDSSGLRFSYTTAETKFVAGVSLSIPDGFSLQPGKADQRVVWQCSLNVDSPVHVFAIRVHAHGFSRANAMFYRLDNETAWNTLVERSPQRPQSFYPLDKPVELSKAHKLVGRCIYDLSSSKKQISTGGTRNDEMCNVYLMYYTTAEARNFYEGCSGPTQLNDSFLHLPEPNKTEMEVPVAEPDGEAASHHHHHEHEATNTPKPEDVIETENDDIPEIPAAEHQHHDHEMPATQVAPAVTEHYHDSTTTVVITTSQAMEHNHDHHDITKEEHNHDHSMSETTTLSHHDHQLDLIKIDEDSEEDLMLSLKESDGSQAASSKTEEGKEVAGSFLFFIIKVAVLIGVVATLLICFFRMRRSVSWRFRSFAGRITGSSRRPYTDEEVELLDS